MSSFWFDLSFALLTIGSGIVVAGLVSSIYQVFTDDAPKFSMLESEGTDLFFKVVVIIFSGPIMLLRNCYYGRILENRPLPYVFGGAILAATWGMLTGLSVIAVAVKFIY